MTAVTLIAVVGSLFTIAIGFVAVLGEGGYRFDLRKKSRRQSKDGRMGGRRAEDRAAA